MWRITGVWFTFGVRCRNASAVTATSRGARPKLLPMSYCPRAARALDRARRAAMALSKLSGDEQGIILGQLCNSLEPRLAVYFSSASSELRVLLTPALRQQLRTDYEAAAALCHKVGMSSCKELRDAMHVKWDDKGLSAADLATLGKLGSVLPALERLVLFETSGSAVHDGAERLVEVLGAGALPAVTLLSLCDMHVGDAGALALAAALGRGALPRLRTLQLMGAAIGDAGLVALAPALRRRPALERLILWRNPVGDEGIVALMAPPPPAGALPAGALPAGALQPPAGALAELRELDLEDSQVSDAGCAVLAAALDSGALPALRHLNLNGSVPASAAAKAAVQAALDINLEHNESGSESEKDEEEDDEAKREEDEVRAAEHFALS